MYCMSEFFRKVAAIGNISLMPFVKSHLRVGALSARPAKLNPIAVSALDCALHPSPTIRYAA